MSPASIPTFDGHNDVALRLYRTATADPATAFLGGQDEAHIDLPKARAGNFAGGFFALFSPSSSRNNYSSMAGERYDIPLPPMLELEAARDPIVTMLSLLLRVERASQGAVTICRDTGAIRSAMARSSIAMLVHLEGADAIDADLHMLDVLHAAGLRSLGPVWSRDTIFGHGVPACFPSSPDCGGGLTAAGEKLVRACNDMKIMIDLSHITEQGFWDVARLSKAPLVATHSNAHALCPSSRNLTDRQLDAIRDSGGVVGLCFATSFLRADGNMNPDTGMEVVVRHLEGLLERLGEDRVAIGSDFDGCVVPRDIGTAAGMPLFYEELRQRGYGETLLNKIGWSNWLDVLERTIG